MARSGTITLTERDRALLETLVRRVRTLSIDQVARRFWGGAAGGRRLAADRVAKLERAGLLRSFDAIARPMLPLAEPLVCWRPHRPAPDFASLARTLAGRWSDTAIRVRCIVATDEAGRGLEGVRAPSPSADAEITHDLHLAEVYFRMADELPARASTWTPETRLPKGQGIKVPDAIVRDGLERTAIEFGGLYARPKLEAFHGYCRDKRMGYELW